MTVNDLEKRVAAVEAGLSLVNQEQKHIRELLTGGIQNIVSQIGLLSVKIDRMNDAADVSRASAEATPAGRELLAHITDLEESVKPVPDLVAWKNEVAGQLKLIKWALGGGALGAAALVLRLLGLPLP